MTTKTTWRPHTVRGELDSEERNDLPKSVFAFPRQRKEPLTDANHVRNALVSFQSGRGCQRRRSAQAFANIKAAARHYDVEVSAEKWQELGKPD